MITIAVYGDSISRGVTFDENRGRYTYLKEGFDKLLERRGILKIINHSRFGATAEEGFEAYEKEPEADSKYIAIAFGGNDCTPNWQGVSENPEEYYPPKTSLASFESTLRRFVDKVKSLGQIPILVTPPPLVAERYVNWISKGLNKDNILKYLGDINHVYRWQEQYALAVQQAARRTRSCLFDLRAFFLKNRTLSNLYCIDGMHPNDKGHQWIARAIERMLPSLSRDIEDSTIYFDNDSDD
ncbi:MAG: SGNH/GDSL hydrolase family protein [Christensenellales bacterium]|jgi:acyl-CoA thioesterase-1